jgi:membrane-associated phospholipid phosphatase
MMILKQYPFPGPFAYFSLLIILFVDLIWLVLSGVSIKLEGIFIALALPMLSLLLVFWVRINWKLKSFSENNPLLLKVIDGTFFISAAWVLVRVLNHLCMTVRLPYRDQELALLDKFLMIDWLSYFLFIAELKPLLILLDYSYSSLTPIAFLVFYILIGLRKPDTARRFLICFFLTAVFCSLIGLFFPAKAAVVFFEVDRSVLDRFITTPGVYHLPYLEVLRGEDASIALNDLPGLTTFPSFHTAATIILMHAFFRTALRWPAIGYGFFVIAATPIYGGHYFIDLVAGFLVAIGFIFLVNRFCVTRT